MTIAFIAHDSKKELMAQFCTAYCRAFGQHHLIATAGTARVIRESSGLPVEACLPGSHGGAEQLSSRVACNEIDVVFFFRDPISAKPNEPNDLQLLRICDVHAIPYATNIATGEVLLHGLERGDLDWREYVKADRRW